MSEFRDGNAPRVEVETPEKTCLLGLLMEDLLARNLSHEDNAARVAGFRGDIEVGAGEMVVTLRFSDGTLTIVQGGSSEARARVKGSLGALLGIPFPRGLALAGQTWPELVPWGWAVNGCASVISAVLAAMIALTWGFSAVVWSAALAYGLAGLVIGPGIGSKGSDSYSSRVKGTNRTPPQL